MNERPLFDTATLTHQECPVPYCQSIRTAGQQGPLLTCQHDLEREGRRPKQCLNRTDPQHTEIPY